MVKRYRRRWPTEPEDPVDQDALTDEWIASELLGDQGAGLSPMGVGAVVPEGYYEFFGRFMPRSILHIWKRFGFEGFSGGGFWITDPVEWAPIVDAWIEPVADQLIFTDNWYCVARNAMGKMFLWGENSGDSLEIDPVYHELVFDRLSVRTFNNNLEARQRQGRTAITGPAFHSVDDLKNGRGRPVRPQALKRLGPVGVDEIYGFTLPPVLGGTISVDNLRIVKAESYLTLQAQQAQIHIDDPIGSHWGLVETIINNQPDQPHPESPSSHRTEA